MIYVIKASGTREPFSEEKLRSSIGRAGIPKSMHDQVVSHVESILRPDIPTGEIYNHILEFLGQSELPHTRSTYSLKQSVMALGPTGYPFEKFVAAVLTHYGYITQVDVTAKGKCVSHEIDVAAEKAGKKAMVECKFHNQPGTRSDIKVALYVQARFEDLGSQFSEPWLITNTKCTTDAIEYGRCRGLKIVAWGYPETGNFADLIEESGLQPVTCLTSLSGHQKDLLIQHDLILCKDILDNPLLATLLRLSDQEARTLSAEIKRVIAPKTS